jgi:hypothetical protein
MELTIISNISETYATETCGLGFREFYNDYKKLPAEENPDKQSDLRVKNMGYNEKYGTITSFDE